MRRPSPMRQQGFGLLAFVMLISVIALTLVTAYAGIMTRREANELPSKQAAYLEQATKQIEDLWRLKAYSLDETGSGNTVTASDVLTAAGVQSRYGVHAALSNVLIDSQDSLPYRVLVLYLSAESDSTTPLDINSFEQTGVFVSCPSNSTQCLSRVFSVFSSLDIERDLAKETQLRLARIAQKAQSYFKARMLQDPERNVSVNYFRMPFGACTVMPLDLGCMDTYQPLAVMDSVEGYSLTQMATSLALTNEDLFSAWGMPLQASNLQDSITSDAPYTMSFRAASPSGEYYTVKAVQQF